MDHSFETQKFLRGAHQEQANILWLAEFLVLKLLHSSFCSSFEAVARDRSNMTEIDFEFDRKCLSSTSLNTGRNGVNKKTCKFRISVLHYTENLQSKIQDQFRSPQSGHDVSKIQYNVNLYTSVYPLGIERDSTQLASKLI